MKRMTSIATALLLAVLAVLGTRVSAQDSNTQERSFLTFSAAVEMPGVTLPAGTYTFRLADTPSRNVVQVLSRDEKDILGQWTFVQAERPEVSQDQVIMFKENREGTTPAVQFWYYPGEKIGKEFIYPKKQAQIIANRTGGSVLSEEGRVSANTTVSSTDTQGNVTPWPKDNSSTPVAEAAEPASVRASAADSTDHNTQVTADSQAAAANEQAANQTLRDAPASSQPTASAGSLTGNRGLQPETTRQSDVAADTQAVGTSGRADTQRPESTQARAELPRTASPMPLAGLIGLLSMAGALGARYAAARR